MPIDMICHVNAKDICGKTSQPGEPCVYRKGKFCYKPEIYKFKSRGGWFDRK